MKNIAKKEQERKRKMKIKEKKAKESGEREFRAMKITGVKRKLPLWASLAIVLFPLPLSGCGKAGQGQEANPEEIPAGNLRTESEQKQDAEPGAAMEGAYTADFPVRISETIGNVTFDMDVIAGADLTDDSVVTAKAQMQKVNREKAFDLFFSHISEYDTYDYEEEDEYGKPSHQVTYVGPGETMLAYGPRSSKFEYREGDLMPYVQNSFVPFQDERYNADLYNTETQLPFMTREDAFGTVQNALKQMGIEIEASYTGYALDHETMQSQEHHEDMDGNPDSSQNKARWSEEDDCYYFYIRQTFRGLPLYYVYNQEFADAVEIDTPVQAVVSGEGIEWLSIENVFAVSEEQGGVSLADMDSVVKTAADKYNQILGDAAYEVTKAQLYYYVDLASGTGTYDMKPAWILTGSEQGGKDIQIIIDARTAEEILP